MRWISNWYLTLINFTHIETIFTIQSQNWASKKQILFLKSGGDASGMENWFINNFTIQFKVGNKLFPFVKLKGIAVGRIVRGQFHFSANSFIHFGGFSNLVKINFFTKVVSDQLWVGWNIWDFWSIQFQVSSQVQSISWQRLFPPKIWFLVIYIFFVVDVDCNFFCHFFLFTTVYERLICW